MTVKQKLLGPILLLSFVICIMFSLTWWISEQRKDDEFVINLAGRQRMLTQKMTKEVLYFQSISAIGKSGAERIEKQVHNTMTVFNKTLTALTYSGDAPLGFALGDTGYRYCPAAVEPALSQLRKVRDIWIYFSADLEFIIANPSNSAEKTNSVILNSIVLLNAMDQAVSIMQKQSEKKGRILLVSQAVGIVVSLCFVIFGIIVINRVTNLLSTETAERKQVEEGLRESEENLTKAQTLSHLGSWKLDIQTMKVTGSEELFNIFGLSRDEMGVDSFNAIFHPDDKKYVVSILQRATEHGSPWEIEHRLVLKNGTQKWVHSIGAAIKDDTGKTISLTGIAQDITERKQGDEALKSSELKFRKLFNSILYGYAIHEIILDPDTNEPVDYRFLAINQAFDDHTNIEAITGLTIKDLIGKTVREVIPDIEDYWIKEYGKVALSGKPLEFEAPADALGKYYHVSAFQNQPGQFAVMFSDITERRHAEEELRKHSQAVEQIGSAIVITDLEGNIEFINPSFTRATGYTREEALGKNPRILKSGQHSPEFYKEMWSKIKDGFTWQGEIINKKKNGELYWENATISPIKSLSGDTTHYVAVKDEISDRKLMQEELIQAKQDADSANQAKSEFLANMSHELRTPLNSIIGFGQILEKKIADTLSEKHTKYFNNIKNSSYHLLEMVNDILDLSKIEAGKTEVDLKPFDLGKMLERSPSIIHSIAYQKKIQVSANIQSDLGWLNGDETKLKQVIYNLFSNAVKFTQSGNNIGIEATRDADRYFITVWDEGTGIPDEYLEKIFDPFEQITGDKTTSEKGTGLGLAISRKLIELHHGSLTVTSNMGSGSRFTIILPGWISAGDKVPQEKATKTSQFSENVTADAKILVAEDNKTNRDLIEAALENYELEFAENGNTAVKMAAENNYDLILLDIQMPGMDGTETMKQIRKNHQYQFPIIAITAYAMIGDRKKYLQEGFDDYISKPLNIELLIQKIQAVLK